MAGPDRGSFLPSPIRTLPSILFAAPPWVCSALYVAVCGFAVLHFYRFSERNCFTEAVSTLGNKTGRGLFLGAGSECQDCRDAEQPAVPWAGRSPGSLPGAPARAVSRRLRSGSGAGSFTVPEAASGICSAGASAGTGEQSGGGRGKVRGRQCQAAAEGIYPFDMRELLHYLS